MKRTDNFTPEEWVLKARIALMKNSPFFGYIAIKMKMIKTDESNPHEAIATMGVNNAGNCYYSPTFISSMSIPELSAVLCHEVMHLALLHTSKDYSKGRNQHLVNIAMDLVVNDILVANKTPLPSSFTVKVNGKEETSSALIPDANHSFTFTHTKITVKDINKKCWQEIYDELMQKLPKSPQYQFDYHLGKGEGEGEDGKGKEGSGGEKGKGGKDKLGHNSGEPDWGTVLNEAAAYAKVQGNAPAGLDRFIEELNQPSINWKEYLRRWIVSEIPFDFSFSRPSKKSVACGVFLPSILREKIEIAVAIDTSGSMSSEDLVDGVSEIVGICRAYDNIELTVLTCDADVHTDCKVRNIEEVKDIVLKGGGGTSFKPVFKWLKENKPSLKCLVFFTDGYGDFPDHAQIHTLWAVTKDGLDKKDFPFGEVVRIGKYSITED